MKRIILCLLVTLWMGMGIFGEVEVEAVGIVVNQANSVSTINSRILMEIYLGKRTLWPDGRAIRLAVLKEGKVHEKFLKEVVKKNPSQFALHWQGATFTGTGVAPKEFSTEEEMRTFVSANPGAVGYISLAGVNDSVKKLMIKD